MDLGHHEGELTRRGPVAWLTIALAVVLLWPFAALVAEARVAPAAPPLLDRFAAGPDGLLDAHLNVAVPARVARKAARGAKSPHPYDQPERANDFFVLKRAPVGTTKLPADKWRDAREHAKTMPVHSTATGVELPAGARSADVAALDLALGTWTSLGPGNIGGRTRSLLINPTNPNVMYAGAVAGGVWRTTDSGATWFPLTDLAANLAVSSLAMDPNDASVIYAGTGEGFMNGDSVRGDGIFKTTTAGAVWTQLATTSDNANFHYVNKIVVSPNNGQRVYAATRTGIMRSVDGGATWAQVLNPGSVNGCTDLVIRTDTADRLFAACGNHVQATIYRSSGGGPGTWTAVFTEAGMGRTSLALAPSDQDTIYALSASIATDSFRHGLHAVFRSVDGGTTWLPRVRNTSGTKLNRMLLSNAVFGFYADCFGGADQLFNQGWYDNVIAVDPTNPDHVWVGGIDLFRSEDGGRNWGLASHWWIAKSDPQYAHADQHAIVFHPDYDGAGNQQMFVGNDGGVFRTSNAMAGTTSTDACAGAQGSIAWTELNNSYAVTQFYHGLPYPTGTTYFGGTQDNGTVRGSDAAGPNGWTEIYGGDGGYVAVNPANTNELYVEYVDGAIAKSTDGGANFSDAVTGLADNGFLFIAPFVMDPGNPQRLWTGGFDMWRTGNGAGRWTKASITLCGNGSVSAIAVAPSNSNRVLAGTSDGCINRNDAATTASATTPWAGTTPRVGYVSSIAIHPTNPNVAYATYSTFGGAHVWRSLDGGTSWTSIDGSGVTGIPDVPVHSIAIDPANTARLYIGTDIGVFVSRDGGARWAVEHTGFAHVVTEWLAVGNVGATPHLFAFTHGRGAWRVATADVGGAVLTVARTGSGRGAIMSTPLGINCGTACASAFEEGTEVELRASPAADSIFVRWSGGCSGTARTCTVTMNEAKTVTATFRSHTVAVTRAGTGTGRVTSTPTGIDCGRDCGGRFRPGTSVTLTATPSAGSRFAGWTGITGCGSNAVCTFVIDANVAVTATFVTRLVTVTKAGVGTGTVTSNPAGINCGATCTGRFLPGATVTLTATAASGSRFDGWSGACTGTALTCTLSMTQDRAVTATFSASAVALTVTKSGTGTGTVTSSPTGISCGSTCTRPFAIGTSVLLTAAPAAGSHFGGWDGACGGTALTCTVTMSAAKSVTATFVKSAQVRFLNNTCFNGNCSYSVTLSAADGYSWTSSTSVPSAYKPVRHATLRNMTLHSSLFGNVSVDGTFTISPGRRYLIVLTADSSGNALLGLIDEGPVADGPPPAPDGGTPEQLIPLPRPTGHDFRRADATAAAETREMEVVRFGDGTITSRPGGIECGPRCTARFDYWTYVTLRAEPGHASELVTWHNECLAAGNSPTCVLRMGRDRYVSAIFRDLPGHSLLVFPRGSGRGVVTSTPAGLDCEPRCFGRFRPDTVVTLKAVAADGNRFDGWLGDECASDRSACDVTMDRARYVYPVFSPGRSDVRFINYLCLAPDCRSFTARLHTYEGYHWVSSSGVSSPAQDVQQPVLTRPRLTAVGESFRFEDRFRIRPGTKYRIELRLARNRQPALWIFADGSMPQDEQAPEAIVPLDDGSPADRFQSIPPAP